MSAARDRRLGNLGGAELARLALALAARPLAWEHLVRHDPDARVFERIQHDERLEAWLICWAAEQDTGFHDHDLSAGGVAVVAGLVLEERLVLGGAPTTSTFTAGDSFHFDASTIHRVRHVGPRPAVTIHAYSPPLERMGAYRVGTRGELIRETVPRTDELRPRAGATLSAAGA
jgi:quercetin dioxygenase-like cupin family protein